MKWRVLLLLAVVACGSDPLEPQPPFRVSFSEEVESKGFNSQTMRHECEFSITATATGGVTGDFARWEGYDGEYRFPDGTTLTFFATPSEAINFWGSDRIATGTTQRVPRIAWDSSETFRLIYSFRFRLPSGEQRSENVFVDCL